MRPVAELILRPAWVLAAAVPLAAAQPQVTGGDLPTVLARVGARVEQYYGRAESIICEETVRLQTLNVDLSWDGAHVRQLVYELRVVREPRAEGGVPEPNIQRRLLSVDGRPPRPADASACDLKATVPEPLAMLLPGQQSDYQFGVAGTKRTPRGSTVMLDFKSVVSPPAKITWTEECVDIDLPGRTRGRVWADVETGDVLRLDEHLSQAFEFPYPREHVRRGAPLSMTLERADSSTMYRPVEFHDPDETLMLPQSIESLQVLRNSGRPRVRILQSFSNYRRFITSGRLVEDSAR